MFSKTIVVDSDDFLDMPVSARLLYYDLGMRADDDGFVNPKMVMRMTGASDDDLKVLLAKKYVLGFENKVLVIRDWKINNFIRPDRYTPTIYKEYLDRLKLAENNQYQLVTGLPDDIPLGDPDKVRLGKVRLGKDSSEDDVVSNETAPINKTELFFSSEDEQERIIKELIVKGFEEKFLRREIRKFLLYWGETNKSGKKKRWECEKFFDLKRRIGTWFGNIGRFNDKGRQSKEREFIV